MKLGSSSCVRDKKTQSFTKSKQQISAQFTQLMDSMHIANNFHSSGPAILRYEAALLLIWVPTFRAMERHSGHRVKGLSFRDETLSDAPKYEACPESKIRHV
jgi:hypothetical protein